MDTLTPQARSAHMARIRSRDTKPEMIVRRLLHGMGYRYRLHKKELPGKPDIVFAKRRKLIFVHGCFWHRHADSGCKLARLPKSRLEFWEAKLNANAMRDLRNLECLQQLGWSVLVVWECESNNTEQLANKLRRYIEGLIIDEGN